MNKQFEKVNELVGTKKTADGRFVDRLFCPYCEQYVDSLVEHLREKHQDD